MERQMELNAIPPRQRARLVEDGPSEGARCEVAETGREVVAPVSVFPGKILDARYVAGLKTEWFDPRTHLPKRSGFYEIAMGFDQMVWYEAPEQAFYTCSGTRYDQADTVGVAPAFVWRGAVESLGRQRRVLLD